jgi:hypothetical protein
VTRGPEVISHLLVVIVEMAEDATTTRADRSGTHTRGDDLVTTPATNVSILPMREVPSQNGYHGQFDPRAVGTLS